MVVKINHLIKPEGLKDYVVSPPLLGPSTYAVVRNGPPQNTRESDDDEVTEITPEFNLGAGDSVEENNIFDIDCLLLFSEVVSILETKHFPTFIISLLCLFFPLSPCSGFIYRRNYHRICMRCPFGARTPA